MDKTLYNNGGFAWRPYWIAGTMKYFCMEERICIVPAMQHGRHANTPKVANSAAYVSHS